MPSKKRKNKKRIKKEDLVKIEKTKQREQAKKQGAFDGRFVTRAIPNKKKEAEKKSSRKKINNI